MTEASLRALENLRNPATLQWYIVPLLALTIYIYTVEIERRNWDVFFAGLALWAMDWLNEIANSIILHVSERSALWTAPDKSAYVIMVGLNIEICFMFSIAGIVGARSLPKDKALKILGIPNRLFIGLAFSIFSVIVEIFLNKTDMLIWEYPFWRFPHVWLIVPFGYLHFYLVAFWVHDLPTVKKKLKAVGALYGFVFALVGIFGVGFGWL